MSLLAEVRVCADAALTAREDAGKRLVDEADNVARACHDMALRFHRGGKLVVFGNGGAGADADHVAVEFVHPVIVGKRALPAVSLNNDAATITDVARSEGFERVFGHQVSQIGRAEDIALGVSPDGRCRNVVHALDTANGLGMLTVALVGGDGGDIAGRRSVDHTLAVSCDDPMVTKELHVTIYHILWELVHVFLERPGRVEREARNDR